MINRNIFFRNGTKSKEARKRNLMRNLNVEKVLTRFICTAKWELDWWLEYLNRKHFCLISLGDEKKLEYTNDERLIKLVAISLVSLSCLGTTFGFELTNMFVSLILATRFSHVCAINRFVAVWHCARDVYNHFPFFTFYWSVQVLFLRKFFTIDDEKMKIEAVKLSEKRV